MENKSEDQEEGKENVETVANSVKKINLNVAEKSRVPRAKLISDSYYKPLNLGQDNDKKKGSSKVTFSDDVDTNEISANEPDTNISASEEQSDRPVKEDGRVRGRQRYNKVVQVKKPSENESDQCKTQ